MQWLMLAAWGALGLRARGDRRRALFCAAYTLAIALSMLTQLRLLWLDGLLTLSTALPLHLCGLMGVLSPWLVWRAPAWLYELSYYLGAPCAFLTLFFPAVIASSQPALMAAAFCRLHALVALVPVFLTAQKKPPPVDPRRAFLLGNGYLLFVGAFNALCQTNYLFLRSPPMGTPLQALVSRGQGAYVLALEVLCMLMMRALQGLALAYRRKYESMYPV